MISFTLDINPVAKGRPRLGRHGTYTPPRTVQFENTVKILAAKYRPKELMTGPIHLVLNFYMQMPQRKVRDYPTVAPDWDNLGKAVSDSLNGVIWKDDAQIVKCVVTKLYDWQKRKPRIEVMVMEYIGETEAA